MKDDIFNFRWWQFIARHYCSHPITDRFTMPDDRVWCYRCSRWVK